MGTTLQNWVHRAMSAWENPPNCTVHPSFILATIMATPSHCVQLAHSLQLTRVEVVSLVNNIVLNSVIRSTVTSIQRTQEALERTSLRLATGKEVNSATDQPQNFFAAQALSHRASDLTKLLDGIGQSIRTIEETIIGVQTLDSLLNQAEAVAQRSYDIIKAGGIDSSIETIGTQQGGGTTLDQLILAENPGSYFKLDESSGPIIDSGAIGTTASYSGATPGASALYFNGTQPSVSFDGDDIINVTNANHINGTTTPARTVELVFNATTTSGRQVLYEEGSTTNGFTIYIDNGLLRITAEDDNGAQRFANLDISAAISANQTYHVAFVFDGGGQRFEGFLDGQSIGVELGLNTEGVFPSHSGGIGIGGVNAGVQWHDGESSAASGFNFNGRISNVAIHNNALSAATLLTHAESLNLEEQQTINHDFNNVLDQINQIIEDAHYRGVNLLAGDDLYTDFNEKRTNYLITEGVDFSFEGLGILDHDFDTLDNIEDILKSVRDARETVRDFGQSITNDLAVISTREEHTRNMINTHLAGSDDLTLADQNEEGANMLALQTRQAMGQTALSLATQSQASILQILSGN